MGSDGEDETAQKPSTVEFHLIKSQHFRVVHVDGGLGGITPRGFCHLAVYNERQAIPRLTVRPLSETGEAGPEETIEVRGGESGSVGVVREIEVDLIFDERTAREIRDWLSRRIEEFDMVRKHDEGTKQ